VIPASHAFRRGRSRDSASNPRDRSSCKRSRLRFWAAASKSARIVHFRAVLTDDRRRATLRTLIELAEGSNPQDCWDDQRAEDLLRSQSNPDELRELGMSEQMIARIFGEKR